MGGNRIEEWMSLFGHAGVQLTVPETVIKGYGYRKLNSITGFLHEGSTDSNWYAISEEYIIIIKLKNFALYVGKGESEHEAKHGKSVMQVGAYRGFGNPSTEEIINFFNFKVGKEQILEFTS